MSFSPFLAINLPCDKTLQWVKGQLSRSSLRSVQTFDLQAARMGSHECACPHHGTAECDCQMVILLVYGNSSEPVTLILHGNGGQTWVSMSDTPNQKPDKSANAAIINALQGNLSSGLILKP